MFRRNSNNDYPQIDKSSCIDPSAVLIGKVIVGKNVFVAPGAVIRADEPKTTVIISDDCNIQDRVVVHALGGSTVFVGKGSSLSHGCIVRGPCMIGQACFIGSGSVIFRSTLADKVFVGHLAVVEGIAVAERRFVPSGCAIDHFMRAKVLKRISKPQEAFIRQIMEANRRLTASAGRLARYA